MASSRSSWIAGGSDPAESSSASRPSPATASAPPTSPMAPSAACCSPSPPFSSTRTRLRTFAASGIGSAGMAPIAVMRTAASRSSTAASIPCAISGTPSATSARSAATRTEASASVRSRVRIRGAIAGRPILAAASSHATFTAGGVSRASSVPARTVNASCAVAASRCGSGAIHAPSTRSMLDGAAQTPSVEIASTRSASDSAGRWANARIRWTAVASPTRRFALMARRAVRSFVMASRSSTCASAGTAGRIPPSSLMALAASATTSGSRSSRKRATPASRSRRNATTAAIRTPRDSWSASATRPARSPIAVNAVTPALRRKRSRSPSAASMAATAGSAA